MRNRRVWIRLLLVVILAPEFGLYLAADHGSIRGAERRCTVLALGYSGDETGIAGVVLRYRMTIALDAMRRYSCGRLIVSGGKPHSMKTEASTMAKYAVEHGVAPGQVTLEDKSTTTAQNIEFSLPKIDENDRILIASDPAHALRAKRYLCRYAPASCGRAYVAAPFKPFDAFVYQWLSACWNGKAILIDALLGS